LNSPAEKAGFRRERFPLDAVAYFFKKKSVPNTDWKIGLSYFNKQQLRSGYYALRADSIGNVFTLFVEPANRAYEFTSLAALAVEFDFFGVRRGRQSRSRRRHLLSLQTVTAFLRQCRRHFL